VAEQIRIAGKENRPHAKHHEHAGHDGRESRGDDGTVVELVFQGILGEFVRWRRRLTHKTQNSSSGVPHVNPVRPDGPEVQEEGGVNDMKEYGEGENGPCDPVIGDPDESETHLREEGGKQEREHGSRHNPVKQPRGQRVSRYALRYSRCNQWRATARKLLAFSKISQIGSVHDEKEKSCDDRNPYQEPSDVSGNILSPRAFRPL